MGKVEGKLDLTEQVNKTHRGPRAGKSLEKKKTQDKKKRGLPTEPEKLNPKAFATGRPGTANYVRRKLDRGQHNAHLPVIDRSFADEANEPPATVAVVGPPGAGKTTLIRSLVKLFTKQNLTAVKGPVTCIAGKQRRITFFECPNNVNAMCDIARVADLVLLVVDASFGFEMETFEFLNIAKSHGFPKLIGVLTHLDKLPNNKQLKKTKKALRHRFWQEICSGAKLFYLSGLERNLYTMKEVVNLNRFIAVTKLAPQNWRTTHSCTLVDRMEDITDPVKQQEEPMCDRKVALYGYIKGCPMKDNQKVHIPGVGDYQISSIHRIDDPCALPTRGNKRAGRHLSEKDKRLYAPMADVGALIYDQDAVYVKVDQDAEAKVVQGSEGSKLMSEMRNLQRQNVRTIDEKLADAAGVSLFEGGGAIGGKKKKRSRAAMENESGDEDDEDEDDEDGDEDMEDDAPYTSVPEVDPVTGRIRRRVHFTEPLMEQEEGSDDDDDDDDEGYDGGVVLASDRPDRVSHDVKASDLKGVSLEDDDEDDDVFFKVQGEHTEKGGGARGYNDTCRDVTRHVRAGVEDEWEVEAVRESIRDLFVTGNWTEAEGGLAKPAAAEAPSAPANPNSKLEKDGYESVGSDDDDENPVLADEDMVDDEGDEEDEEEEEDEEAEEGDVEMEDAAEAAAAKPAPAANGKRQSKLEKMQEDVRSLIPAALLGGGGAAPEAAPGADEAAAGGEMSDLAAQKAAQKKAFDAEYDKETGASGPREKDYQDLMRDEREEKKAKTDKDIEATTKGNSEEKVKLLGYYAGLYVRIVVEGVPVEFVKNFDPHFPIIAGGLLASEDRLGVVYVRMKKHRWYPKILKAGDPLIMSVGWRRFQTQPIFAVEDPNGRNRFLKYTPLHTHCVAAFYGPVTPPNTGVIGFTNAALKKDANHFRCSATGYVMEVDHSSRIVKKLKLTGVPAKVLKNTAFIKNMFSSALEVAKFEGAKLQTVSGLRGTVKKGIAGKGGVFRATFEDKIAKSDIVFLKTWKAIEPSRYYNPVTNLLMDEWQAMKSMTELRRERNIAVPYSADSVYRDIKRKETFNTSLKVPAKLEGALPFDKKHLRFIEKDGLSRQDAAIAQETQFILEPEEQKRRDLLESLTLADNIKKRSERDQKAKKRKLHDKSMAKKEEKSSLRLKELKKKNSKLAEFRSMKKK
eukprot:TRINITY_DN1093_c0_g2_i1.p1 TRINITY_DN1093_c0_g2~~TRINITY_DN1093_c0_g2_i1.p1  ORF type:complete len:1187 (+),score=597.74 TRINITY_DN1093_c0_g2_i1:132-3692(+)